MSRIVDSLYRMQPRNVNISDQVCRNINCRHLILATGLTYEQFSYWVTLTLTI